MEIPVMVHARMMDPDYIASIWPSLKIVMGSNIGNLQWTANVATSITLFNVINLLPVIVDQFEKLEKDSGKEITR